MKNTLLNYEYRTKKLDGGSGKYGACELTGKASGNMVQITKSRRYMRPDGSEGSTQISTLFCTEQAAKEYLKNADSGDGLESAMLSTCKEYNLEAPIWAK